MQNLILTEMEIQILIDALRSQTRMGHLSQYLQRNADKLLIVLHKMLADENNRQFL